MGRFRVPEFALGILAAAAIFGAGMALQSARQQPSEKHTAPNSEHGGGVVAPKESPDKLSDWLLVLFNGLLVGSTVLLWDSTRRLWRTTKEAAAAQASDMQASIAAARESADAAKQAADAAEISARAALRVELPIITMHPPELLSISGPMPKNEAYAGTPLTGIPYENCAIAGLTFLNHGRTPALPTRLDIGFCIAQKLPPTSILLRTVTFDHRTIIAENRGRFTAQIDFDLGLTDRNLEELAEGSILWMWVVVYYDDFMFQSRDTQFTWRWGRLPEDEHRDDAYHFIAAKRVSAGEIESRAMIAAADLERSRTNSED